MQLYMSRKRERGKIVKKIFRKREREAVTVNGKDTSLAVTASKGNRGFEDANDLSGGSLSGFRCGRSRTRPPALSSASSCSAPVSLSPHFDETAHTSARKPCNQGSPPSALVPLQLSTLLLLSIQNLDQTTVTQQAIAIVSATNHRDIFLPKLTPSPVTVS